MVEKSKIFVYIAKFPFEGGYRKIYPQERKRDIDSCSNYEVRQQKFYAWKLLGIALKKSLGLNIAELDIKRNENGKWECPQCFFSLSHSGDFVAVAVSSQPVGIDIEMKNYERFREKIAEKIVTEREKRDISPQTLNSLWTKKEAIFKLLGGSSFVPTRIETADYDTVTKILNSGGESYFITVASKGEAEVDFSGIGKL